MNRNRCSRLTGIGVHFEPESAFTFNRNTQSSMLEAILWKSLKLSGVNYGEISLVDKERDCLIGCPLQIAETHHVIL